MDVPLIFDRGRRGRRGVRFDMATDIPEFDPHDDFPPDVLRQTELGLPEVAENDVVRHYTKLSTLNYAVDTGFYPLGSCTMKYNPKVNERIMGMPGFADLHPLQPDESVPGLLALLYDLQESLQELSGMDSVSLQPAAGAHGELTGMLMIRAYLEDRGEHRSTIWIPDSAHGTNPASAAMAGFQVKVLPSNRRGGIDVANLKSVINHDAAGLMLTNPNTLGLFEEDILEIADVVHEAGGLLYYDGANANAIMGYVRPGDMGFDVVHLNLHKTFSTPHGGGGPGAGPVGVKAALAPYLPIPRLVYESGQYRWDYTKPRSIGKVRSFYGNIGMLVRAYAYLRSHGAAGLKTISETAVLNANYLLAELGDVYSTPYDRVVKHEFVLSLARQNQRGARALDVAKRIIDYGFYPPTVYFPMIVEEALMVEPTETESKETLDRFISAMRMIDGEIDTDIDRLRHAPHDTPVRRLDEVGAARHPILTWQQMNKPMHKGG